MMAVAGDARLSAPSWTSTTTSHEDDTIASDALSVMAEKAHADVDARLRGFNGGGRRRRV